MDQIYNSNNQDFSPNPDLIKSKANIYKPLFFTFFTFFLVTASCLVTIAITKNKTNITSAPVEKITPTETPVVTEKKKSNILNISDIEMEFPEGWVVSSVSENTAKVLTDFKPYKVYLLLDLEKNTAPANIDYQERMMAVDTEYGTVYSVEQGGAMGITGALINGNKYSFLWSIESNQPVPKDLDQIWRPDHNVTPEILLNITKTAKPISITNNETQNWQTYTDSLYNFSIKYPKDWKIGPNIAEGDKESVLKLYSLEYANSMLTGDNIYIWFFPNYKNNFNGKSINKPIQNFLSDKKFFSEFNATKIGNTTAYKATKIDISSDITNSHTKYYLLNKNNVFYIETDDEFSNIELQILNTLTFN